ncbi:MAG TPA: aryl-sulfate sulfotransferase [Lachnospiraceae bacterium]|nr:aryl-sulfate sulfotransferase [Lachnospiraceae bacterium]
MGEKRGSLKGPLIALLFSIAALGIAVVAGVSFGVQHKGTVIDNGDANVYSTEDFQARVMQSSDIYEIKTVYNMDYQNAASSQVEVMKAKKDYTLNKPLLIMNPFGTNVTGLYIYFKTDESCNVEYTVSVPDVNISDFKRTLGTIDGAATKEHEGQLIGLIQGMTNTITLRLYNSDDEFLEEKVIKIDVPDYGTVKQRKLTMKGKKNLEKLSDGLFVLFGYDRRNSKEPRHILFYDNEGVIRAEIPHDALRADSNLAFIDGKIFYACADNKFALVNQRGQVEKIYGRKAYTFHHDFSYDEENNRVIILANKVKKKTAGDIVLSLNLESGQFEEIIDFGNFMPDIRKNAVISAESENQDKLDWVHFNSVQVVNGKHLILSSRELSTIVRINNYYTVPKITYMISDKSMWKGTNYSNLLLKKSGSFISQAGQHSVTYTQDTSLKQGQYYLTMFNNNYGDRASYPNFKFSAYPGVGTKSKDAKNSYYYKYLVDETKGTYKLVDKFKVPYSNIVSNVQDYEGNHIVCSGVAGVYGEYSENGKLLAKYTMKVKNFTYRVMKQSMNGYWFNE